jgi:putative heme iron utilization protein
MVAHDLSDTEPLAHGRVTLVCDGERATGALEAQAREAHLAAVPSARAYVGFGDFSLWVLRVRRVRWVGGYGRMDSVTEDGYLNASPDPTAPGAQYAIEHLNADHPDALLLMGQAFGGYPDASAALCSAIDRYGLDLTLETPRGRASARIGFSTPADRVEDLRSATVELTRNARAALAES